MKSFHQMLGSHAMVRELVEHGVENTPQYVPYEDELQNAEIFPMLNERPDVIQEWGTNM